MSDLDGFRDSRQWVMTGRSQVVGHRKLTYTTPLRKKAGKTLTQRKCTFVCCVPVLVFGHMTASRLNCN